MIKIETMNYENHKFYINVQLKTVYIHSLLSERLHLPYPI